MAGRGVDKRNKRNELGKNRPRFGRDGLSSREGAVVCPPAKRARKDVKLHELVGK